MGQWKEKLYKQAADIFDAKRGPKPVDPLASPERLYSEIGRLKMELDWLKKSLDMPVAAGTDWVSPQEPLALTRQCALTGVMRSTLYAPHPVATPDEQELILLGLIVTEYTRHPFYGSYSRRLHIEISDRVPSEWMADLRRNQWPGWLGIRKYLGKNSLR